MKTCMLLLCAAVLTACVTAPEQSRTLWSQATKHCPVSRNGPVLEESGAGAIAKPGSYPRRECLIIYAEGKTPLPVYRLIERGLWGQRSFELYSAGSLWFWVVPELDLKEVWLDGKTPELVTPKDSRFAALAKEVEEAADEAALQ